MSPTETTWLSVKFKTLESARGAKAEAEEVGLDPMIASYCNEVYPWIMMVRVPSVVAQHIRDYFGGVAARFAGCIA